jgi:hypothetical protein
MQGMSSYRPKTFFNGPGYKFLLGNRRSPIPYAPKSLFNYGAGTAFVSSS